MTLPSDAKSQHGRQAIFCYADGKFISRAFVMLATAAAHDPADLWLIRPDIASGETLNARIQQQNSDDICRDVGLVCQGAVHGYFLRYASALWLLERGYESVLSLDSDCLVLGELAELWNDASSHNVAACRDMSICFRQELCWQDQGPYAVPVWAALSETPELIRQELLALLGITPDQCRQFAYVNAGVVAWHQSPWTQSFLKEILNYVTKHHDWLMTVKWQDQDLLNALLVKHQVRADVLNPDRFNLHRPGVIDRRIIHWAGFARDGIDSFWRPYLGMIDAALDKLGMPRELARREFASPQPGGGPPSEPAIANKQQGSVTALEPQGAGPHKGTVLLTWELGLGIGHLMNLRGIGQELVRRGHQVVAVIRDTTRAQDLLTGTGITAVAAPRAVPKFPPYAQPLGFAHMLGNVGFANVGALTQLFDRWNTLFDTYQPRLVVADHSPSVLFSLWGRGIPRVNVGLAFFCPPDGFPLPMWPPPHNRDGHRQQLIVDEQQLTRNANAVLRSRGRRPIERLSQIFNALEEVFLATYREFDHFGERPGVRYWGHWPFGIGIEPQWPQGEGPKVYSYLNPSPNLEDILQTLGKLRYPTIVLPSGIEPAILARHRYPSLRFETQPLDLAQVATQCDLAVTNAGHGTVATLLLAGKPCYLVSLTLEQHLFAKAVERLRAARLAGPNVEEGIRDVAQSALYRQCAQAFAGRYAGWTPGQQLGEIADRLEALMR